MASVAFIHRSLLIEIHRPPPASLSAREAVIPSSCMAASGRLSWSHVSMKANTQQSFYSLWASFSRHSSCSLLSSDRIEGILNILRWPNRNIFLDYFILFSSPRLCRRPPVTARLCLRLPERRCLHRWPPEHLCLCRRPTLGTASLRLRLRRRPPGTASLCLRFRRRPPERLCHRPPERLCHRPRERVRHRLPEHLQPPEALGLRPCRRPSMGLGLGLPPDPPPPSRLHSDSGPHPDPPPPSRLHLDTVFDVMVFWGIWKLPLERGVLSCL